MSFHGSTQMGEVLDVMRYACYNDDVTHIVIDNLQFMLSGQASGLERFQLQEESVAQLRKFATDQKCHVTLVVHPRKEDDNAPLSVSSIFGSAKVTQEADNVLILQNQFDGKPKYIEVLKNRYSGDLGQIPIEFNSSKLQFVDMSLNTTPLTVQDAAKEEMVREKEQISNDMPHMINASTPNKQIRLKFRRHTCMD